MPAMAALPEPLPDPVPIRPRGPLDARVRPPGLAEPHEPRAAGRGARPRARAARRRDRERRRAWPCARGCARSASRSRSNGDAGRVAGCAGRLPARGARDVDVRASGTTARFLTRGRHARRRGAEVVLDGSARMRERPIGDLAAALRALGARRRDARPRRLPAACACAAAASRAARVAIDARRSSQYVSGVLLAAPCAARDVELALVEGRAGLAPLRRSHAPGDARVRRRRRAGRRHGGLRVARGGYRGRRYAIEPDAQAAVYAFAAAAIAGGRVRGRGPRPPASRQTDLRILEVFERDGLPRRARRGRRSSSRRPAGALARRRRATATDARRGARARGGGAVRRRARPRSATSRTCASRRPTGSRRSRPRSAGSAAAPRPGPTGCASSPAPLHGARSRPTTTTAWRCPSRSPACACRASRSATRAAWRRPGPASSPRSRAGRARINRHSARGADAPRPSARMAARDPARSAS